MFSRFKEKRSTRFLKELKREARVAIAAAIGFIIAYAWRMYVLGLTSKLLGDLNNAIPNISRFMVALIITLVGVLLILASSRIFE